MAYLKLYRALIVILSICFISSHAFARKWTVMVYMNADNNLEREGLNDFIEMVEAVHSDEIAVVVQFDRHPGYSSAFENWSETLRFHIEPGIQPTSKYAKLHLGEQNMGDPNVLRNFIDWSKIEYPAEYYVLIIWGHGDGYRLVSNENLPSEIEDYYLGEANKKRIIEKKYLQSLLDSVSRIKNEQIINLNSEILHLPNAPKIKLSEYKNDMYLACSKFERYSKSKSNESNLDDNQIQIMRQATFKFQELFELQFEMDEIQRKLKENSDTISRSALSIAEMDPFKGVSDDDSNRHDKLFNSELQDVLRDHEFSIIGFDACLMSMMEVGYSLRSKTQYIVASEDVEPGTGWDYNIWLSRLASNVNIFPVALSQLIVDSYSKAYPKVAGYSLTLSAVSVGKIAVLATQIDSLSQELMKRPDEFVHVKRARELCWKYAEDYDNIFSIDLSLLMYHLGRISLNPQIRDMCQQIRNTIEASVVANFNGKYRGHDDIMPSFGSHGIAIYFPPSLVAMDTAYNDMNPDFPIQFVKDLSWDNFLITYLKSI